MKMKIAISMDDDLVKKLDEFSEKYGLNRSQLINNLVSTGLVDVKMFEKVGLMDLAIWIRNFQEKYKDRFKVKLVG